jgi:hypothetical protein
MEIKTSKDRLGIVHQGKKSQFYFQISNLNKYILHYILKAEFKFGVYTGTHMDFNVYRYKESKMIGLFFDITISVFRFGIYLHPICYSSRK